MKLLAIACTCLLLLSATASAGELAVGQGTLDSMGLDTMRPLSENEGMQVRGKAVGASVWGGSVATWGGQSSTNSYFAGSSWFGNQGASAFGNSFSFGGNFGFNNSAF